LLLGILNLNDTKTMSDLRKGLGEAAMSSASDNPPADADDGNELEEARAHLEERLTDDDENLGTHDEKDS
jgi:hypothetical protein